MPRDSASPFPTATPGGTRSLRSPWNNAVLRLCRRVLQQRRDRGSLHGTPFVDPAVPTARLAVPPAAIYARRPAAPPTPGPNYTNAGGTQGPTIAGNQTVQIACEVTGFQVADGNTWWYQIASAPWNRAFYVSADAFYNNGATSGSLLGTPFVDPAVPQCSNVTTGGTPGGETAGGAAHTWTNY